MWLRFVGCIATALALSTSAAPLAQTKVYRIGWLCDGSRPLDGTQSAVEFQQGLRDVGYVEGHNFVIESRYAGGGVDQLPDLAFN